jgi:predicted TIM-barrel fold metal-dependent hydrolase
MIVDASVHLWSDDRARYPFAPIDGVDLPADGLPSRKLFADLDTAGVGGAVVVQPRSHGYDHRYISAALAAYPERLAGVCLVDPDAANGTDTLAELHRARFTGLRLIAVGGADGLAGQRVDALIEAAVANAMSISLLVAPAKFHAVHALAGRHPQATFIVDHLGLCGADASEEARAALVALGAAENTCVRLSALTQLSPAGYPFADLLPLIRALYSAFGGSRLLWGTDYPYVLDSGSYIQSLDAVRFHMSFIAPPDVAAILGGNAARIFHLPHQRQA